MGEIAHVDLDRLRVVATDFCAAAEDVAGLRRPVLEPESLPGSEVGELESFDLIGDQLADVVAGLNGWALAAQASAEAFEHADAANGERFTPR